MFRTFFFYCLFIIVPTQLNAQPYASIFGQKSTEWLVRYLTFDIPSGTIRPCTYDHDTTINGVTYRILKTPLTYGLLLREDTNVGKVWMRDFVCYPTEVLYLDFTLKVGDTFDFDKTLTPKDRTVDSVYTWAGRKHIRFGHAHGMYGKMEFIEGLGCNFGIDYFRLLCTSDDESWFTHCQYKDGKLVYQSDLPPKCSEFPSNISETSKTTIIISPNPVIDKLIIEQASGTQTSIYDMMGRIFLSQSIQTDHQSIDMVNFSTGIYMLWLSDEQGNNITKKIVKE